MADNNSVVYLSAPKIDASNYDDVVRKIDSLVLSADNAASAMQTLRDMAKSKIEIGLDPKDSNKQMKDLAEIAVLMKAIWKINPLEQIEFKSEKATIRTLGDIDKVMDEFARHMASKSNELEGTMQKFDGTFQDFQKTQRSGIAKDVKKEFEEFADVFKSSGKKIEKNSKEMTEIVEKAIAVQYSSSQRLNETGTRRFISQGDGFKTSDTVKSMIANSGISNAQEIVQAYEDQLKSKSDEMMRAIQSVDSKYYNEILNSVGINFTKGGKGGKGGQSANSNFKFSGLGEQYKQWAADYLDVTGEITKAEKQMNEAADLINKKINGDKSVEYLNATDLEKYYVQSYQQLQRVYDVIGKEMPEKITKDGTNLINKQYSVILKDIQENKKSVQKIIDASTGAISFKKREIDDTGAGIQDYIYNTLSIEGESVRDIIIEVKSYKKSQQELIKLKNEVGNLYSIINDVNQSDEEKLKAKDDIYELINQAKKNRIFYFNKDYLNMDSQNFENAINKEIDQYQNDIIDGANRLGDTIPQIKEVIERVFDEFIQYGSSDDFTKLFNHWSIAFDEDGTALKSEGFVNQINNWVTQISQAYKSAGIDITSLNEELQDSVSQLYLMFGNAGVLKGVINTKPIAGDISVQTQTIENLRQRIHELEASVESMKEQGQVDTSKSTQEIKALTDEISNLKIELEQAKQQASQSFEMQEQIEQLKSEIEGYNIQLAQAREYMEKFKEANSELSEADKKKITELEAAISARDQKIAELEKKQLEIEKAVNQTEYDALNKLLIEKNTLITQLTEQTLELQTKLSQISDKIGNSGNGQVDELINQLTNYQSQYQELFDNHIDDKQENAEVKKIQRCQQMNDILNSIADTYERINKYELSDEQKSKISSLKVVDKKHDNKEYDLQDKQQRDIQSGYNSRSISKYNNVSVVKDNSVQSDKANDIGKQLIELYNQLKTADLQKMSSQELQILKARQDLQREQAQEWLYAYEKRQDADKAVIDQMNTVTTLLFEKSEEIQTILNEAAKPKKASGLKAKTQSTKKTQPKAATQQVAEGLEELFEGGKTSETTNGNKQNSGGQAKNEDEKEHGGIEIDSGTITKIEEVIKKNTTAIDKNTAALNEIIESKKPIDNPQLYEVLKRFIKSENIGDKQSVSQLTAYLQKHQSDLSVIGLGTPDKSGKSTTTRLVELLSAFEEKDKLIKTNGETIDFKNFNKKSLQLQKPLSTDDTLINHISETIDNIKTTIDKKLKSPDKKQDSEDDNDVKKILTEINQKISTEKNVETDSDKISKAIVDSIPKVNIDTAQLNDTINKALSNYNATQKSINETFGKILTEIQTIKNNVPQGDSQNNNSQTVTNGLSKVIYELSQKLNYQLQARAHMVESGFVANTEHNTASLDVTDDFSGTLVALSDLLKDKFKEIYQYAQDLSQHSHPSKIATPSSEDFTATLESFKHGKNDKGMVVAIDEIFEWMIGDNTLENINKWNQFIAEYTQKTNKLKSSIDYSEVIKDITGQTISDIMESKEFHNVYVDAANIFKDIGFNSVSNTGNVSSVSKDIEQYQKIAPNMLSVQSQFVDKIIELQKNKGNKFKDSDEEDETRKRLATAFNHEIDYTTNKLKFKSNSMYDAQFSIHEFFQSELQKILIDTLKSNGLENSYRIKSVSDYLSENPVTSTNDSDTAYNSEVENLEQIQNKIRNDVIPQFNDKIKVINDEAVAMETQANSEIQSLSTIQRAVDELSKYITNSNPTINVGVNISDYTSIIDNIVRELQYALQSETLYLNNIELAEVDTVVTELINSIQNAININENRINIPIDLSINNSQDILNNLNISNEQIDGLILSIKEKLGSNPIEISSFTISNIENITKTIHDTVQNGLNTLGFTIDASKIAIQNQIELSNVAISDTLVEKLQSVLNEGFSNLKIEDDFVDKINQITSDITKVPEAISPVMESMGKIATEIKRAMIITKDIIGDKPIGEVLKQSKQIQKKEKQEQKSDDEGKENKKRTFKIRQNRNDYQPLRMQDVQVDTENLDSIIEYFDQAENDLKTRRTKVSDKNSDLSKELNNKLQSVQDYRETVFGLKADHKELSDEDRAMINRFFDEVKQLETTLIPQQDDVIAEATKSDSEKNSVRILLNRVSDIRNRIQLIPKEADNLTQVSEYEDDLKNIKDVLDNTQLSSTDREEIDKQIKDLRNKINQLNLDTLNSKRETTQEANKYKYEAQYEELIGSVRRYRKANSRIANSVILTQQFDALEEGINTDEKTLENLMKYKKEFAKLQKDTDTKGLRGRTFFDSVSNVMQRIGLNSFVGGGITRIVSYLRQMVSSVKELDKEMTVLRRVTNETTQTYDNFLSDAIGKASKLGVTITDLVGATSEFSKLGYSINEAQSLGEAAAIYSKVGFLDMSTAIQSMTSVIQGFKLSAEDAMSVVDKMNQVGNSYAISSAGIGSALQRSASSLVAAGNDIDESIALITAGNTVLADPESVANGIKVIGMRIRGAKSELEESGEETEDLVTSTSKLQEKVKAISGVDIMLDENNFKSTYEIIKEISAVWGDLSDIDQAALLELLAGKNRSNILAAILQSPDVLENQYKTSQNSEGSAQRELEKYLDSIEGKTYQIKSQTQQIAEDVIDKEWIKSVLDMANALLKAFDKVMTFDENKFISILEKINELLDKGSKFSSFFTGFTKYEKSLSKINSIVGLISALSVISGKQNKFFSPFVFDENFKLSDMRAEGLTAPENDEKLKRTFKGKAIERRLGANMNADDIPEIGEQLNSDLTENVEQTEENISETMQNLENATEEITEQTQETANENDTPNISEIIGNAANDTVESLTESVTQSEEPRELTELEQKMKDFRDKVLEKFGYDVLDENGKFKKDAQDDIIVSARQKNGTSIGTSDYVAEQQILQGETENEDFSILLTANTDNLPEPVVEQLQGETSSEDDGVVIPATVEIKTEEDSEEEIQEEVEDLFEDEQPEITASARVTEVDVGEQEVTNTENIDTSVQTQELSADIVNQANKLRELTNINVIDENGAIRSIDAIQAEYDEFSNRIQEEGDADRISELISNGEEIQSLMNHILGGGEDSAEDETGQDGIEQANESTQNFIESLGNASEQTRENSEQNEENAESTEEQSVATDNLVGMYQVLKAKYAQWKQQNPDGTMSQFAAQTAGAQAKTMALTAAQAALNAAWSMGLSFLITTVTSAITAAIKYYDNLAEQGAELAKQFKEDSDSLSEFTDKIKKYKEELNSGNLTENEQYDVRTKLLDIQSEMIDKYGLEQSGIDLVNGSLSDQIAIIERLNKQQANNYLTENKSQIEEAEKFMSTGLNGWQRFVGQNQGNKRYYKKRMEIKTSDLSKLQKNDEKQYARISQLAQKNGLTISGDLLLTDGLEYYEKEDALKNFAQDIRNSQIIDTNDVDNLLKFIEKRINSMQTDSYKNNKEIMANAQISMIMTDSEYSEIYNDITEQTNAYNEQIAKGDLSGQAKYFEELNQLYSESTDENNVGNVWVRRYFEDMFDGVISSMRRREYQNEMKDTRGKTYTSAKEVIDMYFEVADDQTIKNAVEGTEEYIALMNLVDESPVDSIEELVDSWVELGLVTSKTLKDSSSQVSSYASIIEGLSDSMGKRDKLSSAISSMLNGETLDMSTLSELLETYPDLIDDMTFANGKYTVSLEGLKKAQNAVMQQAGLNLGEKISDSRKQIDDLYSKIDVWEKAITRDKETKSEMDNLQTRWNNIQRQKQSTEDKIQSNNDIIVSNNEEYISLTKNQERYSRVQDDIYEKTGEYTKQAKYRYDAAMSTISAEKNINEETKKAIKSNEKLVGLRKTQDAIENNVLTDIAQQGYTLNENGEIVTKTGQTYHDLSNQTRIYNSNINEARKSIEAHEKEIKQLRFAWQYAMYQAKDYAGQVNSILSGSTSANDLIQQMASEQEQYGSVSADTQASFMEIVPNWAEYLDTTEDGIIKLVENKTNDIVDGVTNYTEKIETAQKELDEARRRQAVNASSEQVLGYMMNKYSEGSILYDTNKSYDENLAQFREWVNKTPEVYKQIGQAGQWLSNLERERMDSSIQIDTAQDAYNILKQAGEASDNQAKISDFTQQIQVLEKQLDREEITSTQFADAFEELFEKIFGELFDDTGALMGEGFSSTQIATLEEWWKKNRDQLKQKAENEYSTAISDAERQFQLGNITAQELQSKKSALNEQYYGQNGTLGQTDEGKRAYQENAEQVADMNKDIFDELNEEGQRLKTYQDQSAKEYWTHYLEYAETYLKGMPKEYKAAMDEYHTTGVKEMYDEDLQILENNLTLGLITTAQYWSQREQLYKQYLANEPALHEDAIQEEITLRTEAITQQFEREQTLLERNYENGAITAAEYLDEYKKLWEQYYKDKKELAEEDYETQKNLLDATKNALSEQIDSLEDYNEELVAPYQSEIDALNETKDKYDDVINTKVKGLEKQKKAIEKANEQQEKENNLLEKKNALEKASIQNRLVYTGSGNWEARRDDEAYESALKDYNDAAETKLTDQIDKQIEALQEAQENVDDSIEKEIKNREEIMSELKQPVETLIDVLNEILNENKGIDPEFIKNMLGTEKGQQAWDKMMSAARTNDRIANKYGQSLYKQTMSEGEVYSLLNDIAKEYGMSTYEFANSLGLDLPALQKQSDAQVTAVSDDTQAVIDNTTSQDANTQALNDLTTTLGGTVTATEENTKEVTEFKKRDSSRTKLTALDEFNEKMQAEFGLGNVDLTNRPLVDVGDGSTQTVYSGFEFLWQGDDENGNYVAVTYTPILPNGTVLDDETLRDYIYNSLNGANDILAKDDKGIILKVEDFNFSDEDIASLDKFFRGEIKESQLTQNVKAQFEATEEWGVELHNVQAEWLQLKRGEISYFDTRYNTKPQDINEKLTKDNTEAVKENTKSTVKQTAAEKKAEQATKQTADQAQAQTYFSTKELEQIYAGTYNISSGSKIFKANGMPQLVKQINGNAQLAQYEANKEQLGLTTKTDTGSQYVSLKDIDTSEITNPDTLVLTKCLGIVGDGVMAIANQMTTSNANEVKPNVVNNAPVITTNITVEGSADQKTIDAIGEKVESTITTMLNKATQSITSGYQKQMYTNK